MSDLRKLVQVMFPTVRAQPTDYLDVVLEEMALLGIEASRAAILCAASIIKSEGDLEAALKVSDTIATPDIASRSRLEQEDVASRHGSTSQSFRPETAVRMKKEHENMERQKEGNDLAGGIVQGLRELLRDNPDMFRMHPIEYRDYSAVCVMGDDITEMSKPMRVVMKEGWVPLGGVHVAYDQETGAMLFSQAIGLPKGKR